MDTSAVINVNVQSNDTPQAQYKTVILKPNMVDDVNTLTQAMLNVHGQNTKFVIKYDYTLGENITIPANCVLEFDGGSIGGEHTITGTNTGIEAGLVKIFSTDVTLAGTWNIEGWYVEWFGAKGDGVTDCTLALQKVASFNDIRILFSCGKYVVTNTINAHLSTSTWVGSVESSSQWQREGTTILYKGSTDVVILHLPNSAENICVSGDFTVDDDASSFVGTGLCLGGYGDEWTGNGRYRNITTRFFKIGIHLDASFGCVFDGLKVTNNYIGIDADPIYVDGQDSGYIPLLTINSFEIANNKKHAIYKNSETDVNGGINVYFNNGYIESNGDSTDAQIKGTNGWRFIFRNVYGEGTNTLIDATACNISLISCKFAQTSRINCGTGKLIIYDTNLWNAIIEGTGNIDATASDINGIADMDNLGRAHDLRNVYYGSNINLPGITSRHTINKISSTKIKGEIDRWKVGQSIFVYDIDLGGTIFKNLSHHFGNIPAGDNLPDIDNEYLGVVFFDNTLKRPAFWAKKFFPADPGWVGADGFSFDKKVGTTLERPVGVAGNGKLTNRDIGYQYFDTDLGKPIYVKAIDGNTGIVTWVDATGTTV